MDQTSSIYFLLYINVVTALVFAQYRYIEFLFNNVVKPSNRASMSENFFVKITVLNLHCKVCTVLIDFRAVLMHYRLYNLYALHKQKQKKLSLLM